MTNNILRLADELKLPSRDRYVVRNKDSADVNAATVISMGNIAVCLPVYCVNIDTAIMTDCDQHA